MAYSKDMQELTAGKEEIANSIAGHKACLSNPNTSAAAKRHSEKMIAELGGDATQVAIRENPVSDAAREALEKSPDTAVTDTVRIRNDHESRTRMASLEN